MQACGRTPLTRRTGVGVKSLDLPVPVCRRCPDSSAGRLFHLEACAMELGRRYERGGVADAGRHLQRRGLSWSRQQREQKGAWDNDGDENEKSDDKTLEHVKSSPSDPACVARVGGKVHGPLTKSACVIS